MNLKTFLHIVFFMFLMVGCFAETELKTFVSGAYTVCSDNDGLYFRSNFEGDVFFNKNKLSVDENGWKKILSDNLPFGQFDYDTRKYVGYDSPFIIEGSNYAIILASETEGFKQNTFITQYFETLDGVETFTTEQVLEYLSPDYKREEWGNIPAWHNITNINASSFYKEKGKNADIKYVPQVLPSLFSVGMHCTWIRHNPWVPGKEKNSSGLEEYLEIDFSNPSNNLVVLNGYVDPFKHYLYKANNRVKKAVITSLDKNNPFEFEYDFEDYVHFSEINFPKATNKVRLTIKEVYKGEKWDDTCITAVITRWEQ